MSNHPLRFATFGAAVLFAALPMLGRASTIFLPRDTVVPVIIENDLTLRNGRSGDRFTAHVDGDRDLPRNTRLIGRIRRVERERDEQRAFVDLEFTDVILPDGSRHDIRAVPVSLDDRYTRRNEDGRIVVREDVRRKEGYVLGGAVGGFVLGSIIHKQAEATVLGTLAGIIAAQVDKSNDGNTVLCKGQRIGMLIDRDTRIESYGRLGDRRGRRDDRDYDRRDDRRWDDRDDRGNDRQDDRYYNNRNDNRNDNRDDRDVRRDDRSDRRTPVISYDGRDIRFNDETQPYREGETVMVPLEQMVHELGLSFEKGRANAVYIEGENNSLRLEQGSTEARLNGRRVDLACSVTERQGVLYAPVEILASLRRGDILVNGNRIEPKA